MQSSAVLLLLLSCAAVPASSLSSGEAWPWSRRKAAEVKLPEAEVQLPKPVALGASGQKVMVKTPTRPGCWMRMPSGCPNDPMDTKKWRHDTWAESEGLDEASCQLRVSTWNGYCGAEDAMMAFVAREDPLTKVPDEAQEGRSEPLSALQISATHSWSWPWSRQAKDEKPKATAKVHTSSIMEARDEEAPVASGDRAAEAAGSERAAFASGKEGKVMVVHPTRPGCWMRMASGCPKKPDMQTELWRHDTWAEKHEMDESGCQSRGAVWNSYCGSEGATMAFVAKQ
jgi:hypothetical protein